MKISIAEAILIYSLLCMVNGEKPTNKTFVATNNWQEIAEGQGIPAGLHVRINLQTGKKEAKLFENRENEREVGGGSALSTVAENVSDAPIKGTAKHKLKLSKTLTDALKQTADQQNLAIEYSPEKLEKIKHKYQSYKELKDSYNDLRKNFKTDAELITQLIAEYRNLTSTKGTEQDTEVLTPQSKIIIQLKLLDNFNYLLHQIDNALIFIEESGLEIVLLPIVVNETSTELRVSAMRVLGALTQNNPKAQVNVFEHNFGSHLSQILIKSDNTDELSTALYALGSLIRKFPYGQQRILSTSGTQALIAVLSKKCELKVKAKAITLISDIIIEKQFLSDHIAHAEYMNLNFEHLLESQAYCDILETVLSTHLLGFLEEPILMEYFAVALENTKSVCMTVWSKSPQLRHTLLTLKNRYTHSGDEYRLEVAQLIANLTDHLYDKRSAHDEF